MKRRKLEQNKVKRRKLEQTAEKLKEEQTNFHQMASISVGLQLFFKNLGGVHVGEAEICPEHVPNMSRACPEHVPSMSRTCPERVPNVSRVGPE